MKNKFVKYAVTASLLAFSLPALASTEASGNEESKVGFMIFTHDYTVALKKAFEKARGNDRQYNKSVGEQVKIETLNGEQVKIETLNKMNSWVKKKKVRIINIETIQNVSGVITRGPMGSGEVSTREEGYKVWYLDK